MEQQKTDAQARDDVWKLIKDIKYCLMVTKDSTGAMHARPMSAVNVNENESAHLHDYLWFFTREYSRKTDEIEANSEVLLAYGNADDNSYVSINGRARLVDDRAKIKQLWVEPLRAWFPEGSDDPRIQLIHVKMEFAEYWNAPMGTLAYIYGYVSARLTGKTPKIGEHDEVTFTKAS